MRNFACLSKDDTISINYNEKDYELLVLETKPKDAVSIIECDMDVDFAPPVGYEEPNYKATTSKNANQQQQQQGAGQGAAAKIDGYRLDGKTAGSSSSLASMSSRKRNELSTSSMTDAIGAGSASSRDDSNETRGRPFYDYRIGLIRFHHNFDQLSDQMVIFKLWIVLF